ncbi:Permease of the drug/metabolite transporter (DMT) superfamily [Yoonia rosea]|uniref:Permease of the drug/metabolite transporter (DMT) superfamily n=1 Tax=Yoonia rosea TaxID=287098 RepID=A0A1R3WQZ4_9RHOB|nr:DMT family transporter [Yoonia rosea]SIT79023.1 Permease of the drug/metabolite transporter (DMT) superfamily [Yoonia rosea]
MAPVQKTISPQAWAGLMILAFIWGGSFLSVHVALEEIGPLTSVAHRTGWAMLILWAYVLIRRLPLPTDRRVWGAFLVMGLLNNVIPFSLMAWGQLHIETGLTSILNAATAIFGVTAAALFLADERMTARKAIGVGIGFLGVSTAIGLNAFKDFDIRSLGQLAVIGGTISYALAGVWARKTLGHLKPQVAAAGMLTGASLITLPAAWIIEGPITLSLQPQTWAAITYYAVVATAIAYILYYRVLALAGSGNAMLVTLLVAPVAIVLGAIVLGEALPLRAYIGFAILALGLLILDGRLVKPLQHRLRRA